MTVQVSNFGLHNTCIAKIDVFYILINMGPSKDNINIYIYILYFFLKEILDPSLFSFGRVELSFSTVAIFIFPFN